MTSRIKICGIKNTADAEGAVERGAAALGLNFWPGTPRAVNVAEARAIADAVRGRVFLVGVFVDADEEAIARVLGEVGLDEAQLHGGEPPALLERLHARGLRAYKALGVREGERAEDVLARTRLYPGEKILLDTKVPGAMPGGTGVRFDGSLAVAVAAERELILAGGLKPENVAEAVREVRPAWVDTASGVELAPGVKDMAKVEAFVRAASGL